MLIEQSYPTVKTLDDGSTPPVTLDVVFVPLPNSIKVFIGPVEGATHYKVQFYNQAGTPWVFKNAHVSTLNLNQGRYELTVDGLLGNTNYYTPKVSVSDYNTITT